MYLDAIFLQGQHVGPVVVFVDPAVPHFRIGFLILVAIDRPILDERPDCRIDDGVVLPERIFQITLDQLVVVGVFQGRHQQ